MDLGTLFEFAVDRYPYREAVVQGEIRLTFKDLNHEANILASALQAIGVTNGDRVLLVLKNRIEMVVLYWAIQKIGAVFTPINFRLSSDEVNYCMQDSQAKVVIYEPASEEAVQDALKDLDVLRVGLFGAKGANLSYTEFRGKGTNPPRRPKLRSTDVCLMLYTSGTTGRPKGVPRTHENEYGAVMAHIVQNQYTMWESTLGAMPLYHTMGMRSLLAMAFLNGKIVVLPDYSALMILNILQNEKISCVYLVPTIIHDVVNHPNFSAFNLSALKKLGYAGAAMTKNLTAQCYELLRPEVFVNHYGSTEVYTYSICNYLDRKPGCAGKPGFHQRLRVVTADPDGGSTPDDVVEAGVAGEIIVDTQSIESFQGYWRREDATQRAIRQGWYFTGDIGILDPDGDLYVLGRVDDMIISGGENIHPLEVEDVLAKHPMVEEVAVVGIPDERWGEVVTAFVVPKSADLSDAVLDEYCKNSPSLTNFKRPRKYYFVDAIPKSPVGKILRRNLRDGNSLDASSSKESVS